MNVNVDVWRSVSNLTTGLWCCTSRNIFLSFDLASNVKAFNVFVNANFLRVACGFFVCLHFDLLQFEKKFELKVFCIEFKSTTNSRD